MATMVTDTIRLHDGRTLEFGEYGLPDGVPVVFFHGFLGSLHQASLAHEAARAEGLRLIAPNRPGVGRSSLQRYRHVTDFAADLGQLVDRLGLREFGLLAVSGGCPFALGCAYRMPERARLAAIVSGLGPLGSGALWGMAPQARLALLLSRRCPAVARWLLEGRMRAFQSSPERYECGFVDSRCGADMEVFADSLVQQVQRADLEAVLVRGAGARALVGEMRLYFNWGFHLRDLPGTTRVLFWHGTDDPFVPASMTRFMAGRIPNSEATFLPGGHFLAARITSQVMAQLGHALRSPPPAAVPSPALEPAPVPRLALLARQFRMVLGW